MIDETYSFRTMELFIEVLVEEHHKPRAGANLAKSLAKTALMNLVTLPFGFVGFSVTRSKSKREIVEGIKSQLYSRFNYSAFASLETKERLRKQKLFIETFFDKATVDVKMKVINLALTNKKAYEEVITELLRDANAA